MTVQPIPTRDPVVRLERVVPASPDAVFEAWTNPDLLGRWMSPVGHAEASVDLRVGGALSVAMVHGDTRIEHSGEFLELDRPRRLRFTWSSPYTGPTPSIVTVTLEQDGAETRLVVVHERLSADVVVSHEGGWSSMVDRLVGLLSARSHSKETQ